MPPGRSTCFRCCSPRCTGASVSASAPRIVSALAFNFFHIPPTGRFTFGDEQNWVALLVYLVAAAVTSSLAGSVRARAEEADLRRRGGRPERRDGAGASRRDESSRNPCGWSASESPGRSISPGSRSSPVGRSSDQRRRGIADRRRRTRAGTLAVPKAATAGRWSRRVKARVIPSLETLLAAARRTRRPRIAGDRDRAPCAAATWSRRRCLRSVSHDLRSPLTAITAAAAGLQSSTLDEEAERSSSPWSRGRASASRDWSTTFSTCPGCSPANSTPAPIGSPPTS